MRAAIRGIASYLPKTLLSNQQLAADFPEWTAEKITEKTGIDSRHIAVEGELSSDLAVEAAQLLFASGVARPAEIDYLLLCTQSPDYFLPTTACLLQNRLGIPTSAGALDFNLGCSGWVMGLGLANGLILSGQARRVLLLTAETYSKFIHPQDKSVRTIFGDAAAATLIEGVEGEDGGIGPFLYGTDGSGGQNLIVPAGGMRKPRSLDTAVAVQDENGSTRSPDNLFMNGPEIFNFTLRIVPKTVTGLLERSGLALGDVDWFVFHQANRYMLEHLRRKLKVPAEKFPVVMNHCGNTVSSSIPIALEQMTGEGALRPGQRVMVVGFGVGYSWAGAMLRWV